MTDPRTTSETGPAAAAGETDLARLLRSMQPELRDELFVFATLPLPEGAPAGASLPAGLSPVMTFREIEGVTLILPQAQAEALPAMLPAAWSAALRTVYPCRMITLTVHSSLEAVGFLAAVTAALARAGISVNPVSAFHHDHLFVPAARADEALAILRALAGS